MVLCNLAGGLAATLPRRLPNFRAIEKLYIPISHLRDFARSCDKTFCRIWKRSLGHIGQFSPGGLSSSNSLYLLGGRNLNSTTSHTYPTMHQSHIPQCIILSQKCAHVCPNGALWDICLMDLWDWIRAVTWWRHQMVTCSTLLAICAVNSPVTGEFTAQRPVTRSFDVFFDLRLNNSWVNNGEAGDHYDVTRMHADHKHHPGLMDATCFMLLPWVVFDESNLPTSVRGFHKNLITGINLYKSQL